MAERYGKTRVTKIKAAIDDLRKQVRMHDSEATERAFDRLEPWLDFLYTQAERTDRCR